MNGKMDLTQAEAVMDLIQAEARKSTKVAAAQLHGALSKRIRQLSDDVYRLLAQVELILEYPEHEETDESLSTLISGLESLADSMAALQASFGQGRILREGMTVVIAGRPNAGKSSLLNALAGYDRAIVTSVPGTTRDTIEELVDINGIPVRLIDTAGLRTTDNLVEKIGVDRARSALLEADLVFWLASPPLPELNDELKKFANACFRHSRHRDCRQGRSCRKPDHPPLSRPKLKPRRCGCLLCCQRRGSAGSSPTDS